MAWDEIDFNCISPEVAEKITARRRLLGNQGMCPFWLKIVLQFVDKNPCVVDGINCLGAAVEVPLDLYDLSRRDDLIVPCLYPRGQVADHGIAGLIDPDFKLSGPEYLQLQCWYRPYSGCARR